MYTAVGTDLRQSLGKADLAQLDSSPSLCATETHCSVCFWLDSCSCGCSFCAEKLRWDPRVLYPICRHWLPAWASVVISVNKTHRHQFGGYTTSRRGWDFCEAYRTGDCKTTAAGASGNGCSAHSDRIRICDVKTQMPTKHRSCPMAASRLGATEARSKVTPVTTETAKTCLWHTREQWQGRETGVMWDADFCIRAADPRLEHWVCGLQSASELVGSHFPLS